MNPLHILKKRSAAGEGILISMHRKSKISGLEKSTILKHGAVGFANAQAT
jgi:hypothetical protein